MGNKKPRLSIQPGHILVETAGQLIHIFQYGLDYSFTCLTAAGESVLWAYAHPSTPWDYPLGAYESLAGLLVSHSPDGVGVG